VASNIFTIGSMVVAISASLIFATSIYAHAGWSSVRSRALDKAQENGKKASTPTCPGCDADVTPGSCGGHVPSAATAPGARIPYGPGAYRYRDASGINNANRAIGRSIRSLNDSERRMDNAINRIRNINRRF
jgi:hypothetical protein